MRSARRPSTAGRSRRLCYICAVDATRCMATLSGVSRRAAPHRSAEHTSAPPRFAPPSLAGSTIKNRHLILFVLHLISQGNALPRAASHSDSTLCAAMPSSAMRRRAPQRSAQHRVPPPSLGSSRLKLPLHYFVLHSEFRAMPRHAAQRSASPCSSPQR